jgi:hypothetical protein
MEIQLQEGDRLSSEKTRYFYLNSALTTCDLDEENKQRLKQTHTRVTGWRTCHCVHDNLTVETPREANYELNSICYLSKVEQDDISYLNDHRFAD